MPFADFWRQKWRAILSLEAIIGTALAVTLPIAGWMFAMHSKVSVIVSTMLRVEDFIASAEKHRERINEKVAQHGVRLDNHEQQLKELWNQ